MLKLFRVSRLLFLICSVVFFISACIPTVNLISPKEGEIVGTVTPTLKWFVKDNKPRKYELVIASDRNFSNIILRTQDINDTKYKIKESLMPAQYFWRVRGSRVTKKGEFFTPWSTLYTKNEDETEKIPFHFIVSHNAKIERMIDKKSLDMYEIATPNKNYIPSEAISQLTQITFNMNDDYHVTVSNNGRIAFTSDRSGNPDIFLKRQGKVGVTQLTFTESIENNPFWFDNSTLMFNSNSININKFHLFKLTVGGGTQAESQITISPSEYWVTSNIFPDKKTLIFSQKSPSEDTNFLWLLESETQSFTQTVRGFSPAVSKDGNIAYVSDKAGKANIWMMDVNMTKETQITGGKDLDFDPAWSPDGKWIAFASNRSGNTDIWLMRIKDQIITRLTTHPLVDRRPSFSPDGDFIYFESERSGNKDIWRMRLNKSKTGT